MLEHPKCRSTWDNMPCIGACYHLSYFELSAFLMRLPVELPHIKAGPDTLCLSIHGFFFSSSCDKEYSNFCDTVLDKVLTDFGIPCCY